MEVSVQRLHFGKALDARPFASEQKGQGNATLSRPRISEGGQVVILDRSGLNREEEVVGSTRVPSVNVGKPDMHQ